MNGTFRQALNMNSIQSWQYEGNNNYNGSDQNPADGDPRDFWDEFHAFVSGAAIPAGATFSLQKDSANTAPFYWINSIDLWDAPAAAAQPANSISITSCGAVADNTPTNGAAAPGRDRQHGRHPELHQPGGVAGQDPVDPAGDLLPDRARRAWWRRT